MVAVKHSGDVTPGHGQCVQHSLLLGETVHSLINVIDHSDLDPTTQQKMATIAELSHGTCDQVCNFDVSDLSYSVEHVLMV